MNAALSTIRSSCGARYYAVDIARSVCRSRKLPAMNDVPRLPFMPLDARTSEMIALLEAEQAIVNQIIHALMSQRTLPPATSRICLPMAWAVGNSIVGLVGSARDGRFREAYISGRALLETIVNTMFILAEGEVVAARAERHAMQKAARDLKRESSIGKSIINLISGDVLGRLPQDIQDAIDEFSRPSGAEIQQWTPESLDERIARIGGEYGEAALTRLHFARFGIYRYASEIMHGTYFGALFSFGQTQPNAPTDAETLKANANQHLALVLFMTGLACDAFVAAFARDLRIPALQEESTQAIAMAGQAWR